MKFRKYILLFLLVVFVVFIGFVGRGAYQLQAKNTSEQDNSEKQQSENTNAQVDTNRCWQISQLRAENVELKKQLESMKNKIEDEGKTVDDLKGEIAFWFSFGSILVTAITMIVAIIAIVVPLYNVSEIKEKQKEVEAELEKQRNQTKDLQTLAESAKEQASLATQAAKEAKNSSEHMQTQVEYVGAQAKQAEQAANDAKAIQIFVLALKEPNPENALHLYEILIKEYGSFYGIYEAYFQRGILKYKMNDLDGAISEFDNAISINQGYAMAYRNRGLLKYKLNNYDGAMGDYGDAIKINPDYAEAYCNRAECLRKLAENEQDPAKKADYIAKAEKDEKKYEELIQKGKV